MAKERRAHRAEVVGRYRLTPSMVRVVLSGPGGAPLDIEGPDGFTDAYVKLLLPRPGSGVDEPFDAETVRDGLHPEQWPVMRTYTIRSWDPALGRMSLDVVLHGDEGVAGPWSVAVRRGDQVQFYGPGGGYRPDPSADWHLLVGDESALPAIAAALEAMGDGVPALVFLEVENAHEEQPLPTRAEAMVRWVHRDSSPSAPGVDLVQAVRDQGFLPGRVHAFVHGDAGFVKDLRTHLRFDRGVPKEDLSASGYWRRGLVDEEWRAAKRLWMASVEAEEISHA